MSNYFVMLNTQRSTPVPLVDDEGDPYFFETMEEARQAALNNILGDAFGYEIFERGTGDS